MAKDDLYPTSEQIKAQERKFQASRMEEESQLRSVFGTPEEREHERMRVNQEWDKIDQDKAQNRNEDELWRNHVDRMTRMATSLRCPKKAARRAKHFEMAGLSTAAKLFNEKAERLAADSKKPLDPEKDLLISNLEKFNEFVADVEKYQPRQVWEVWTQPSGKRVTKIPSGNIVPFEGGVVQDRDRSISGKTPTGAVTAPEKKKDSPAERRQAPPPSSNKFGFKKGANGKLTSSHFSKSLAQLIKEVRAYLKTQRDKSKYVLVRDMKEEQRKRPDFRKYNSGIGQSETYAREYGEMGLGEKDSPDNERDRKFLLGMSLVMRDVADEFSRMRDSTNTKQEK
jgi:hypothetical protein